MTRSTRLLPLLACLTLLAWTPESTLGQVPNSFNTRSPNGVDELKTAANSLAEAAGLQADRGRSGLPGPRLPNFPRSHCHLGSGSLFPHPDRRHGALLQVPPGVSAGPDRSVPARSRPIAADQLWPRALEAVGRAWGLDQENGKDTPDPRGRSGAQATGQDPAGRRALGTGQPFVGGSRGAGCGGGSSRSSAGTLTRGSAMS